MAKIDYAIVLPVGPDLIEIDRVADLIESVRASERGRCWFVMVDDGIEDRKLTEKFEIPANWVSTSIPHPRRKFPERAVVATSGKGICSAVLAALSNVATNAPEARFTLKLDTDALIIGPFVEKLATVVAAHADVGMIGAYDRTPNGDLRDTTFAAHIMRSLHKPAGFLRRVKNTIARNEFAIVSSHIAQAISNGYNYGDHCLGGAYACSAELLKRMKLQRYLEYPQLWLPIDSPEDVMLGMYSKAVGLRHFSYVGRNEVFGVRYKGLADTPQALLDRGFSVIHAVKNDKQFTELQIRQFFKEHRTR